MLSGIHLSLFERLQKEGSWVMRREGVSPNESDWARFSASYPLAESSCITGVAMEPAPDCSACQIEKSGSSLDLHLIQLPCWKFQNKVIQSDVTNQEKDIHLDVCNLNTSPEDIAGHVATHGYQPHWRPPRTTKGVHPRDSQLLVLPAILNPERMACLSLLSPSTFLWKVSLSHNTPVLTASMEYMRLNGHWDSRLIWLHLSPRP